MLPKSRVLGQHIGMYVHNIVMCDLTHNIVFVSQLMWNKRNVICLVSGFSYFFAFRIALTSHMMQHSNCFPQLDLLGISERFLLIG